MGWMEFVLGIATLVLGTGWIFTWRAYRRKSNGEATQAEADGWLKQQEVYQKTIDDLDGICDKIREDRNHLREDRELLRNENEELRNKINDMESQILDLTKKIARLGRRIDGITPLVCGKINCKQRLKFSVGDVDSDDDDANNKD